MRVGPETRLPGGRCGTKVFQGPVLPISTATVVVITRSMKRNWVSPRFVLFVYRISTDMNWI